MHIHKKPLTPFMTAVLNGATAKDIGEMLQDPALTKVKDEHPVVKTTKRAWAEPQVRGDGFVLVGEGK